MGDAAIDRRKRELRRRLRLERTALDADERARTDDAIARRVRSLSAWDAADAVFAYLSFGGEVDTHALIRAAWVAGKAVALPRVVPGTRRMRWYRVDTFDGLVPSSLGMSEPRGDPADELYGCGTDCSIALVPGLAFDGRGCRLGYGGGFYDGFLAGFAGVAVGLCRAVALYDDLAVMGVVDAHDRSVDVVVTERGVTGVGAAAS